MTTNIATHESPAARSRANFLIFARIDENGLNDRLEQLWARQVDEDLFEVCCIPFFTYGLGLGDIVRTKPDGDRKYVVHEVIRPAFNKVIRFWLGNCTEAQRSAVDRHVAESGLLYEKRGVNLIAIDVPPSNPRAAALRLFASELGVPIEDGKT